MSPWVNKKQKTEHTNKESYVIIDHTEETTPFKQ